VTAFVVNVVTKRRAPARRFATVHDRSCRWARLPMRRYEISAAEVLRLHSRIQRGDGGVMRTCKDCRPDWTAARREDGT
jgi:hypothetical protein